MGAEALWTESGAGYQRQLTGTQRLHCNNQTHARPGIADATHGVADVWILRPVLPSPARIDFGAHTLELMFAVVLTGSAQLQHASQHRLGPGDSFSIPAGDAWSLSSLSEDFSLLQVVLPAQ